MAERIEVECACGFIERESPHSDCWRCIECESRFQRVAHDGAPEATGADARRLLEEERAENARLKGELAKLCESNSEAREFIRHLRKEGGRS